MWKSEGEEKVQLFKYAYFFATEMGQHLRIPCNDMELGAKSHTLIGWS
jgi:hypothetical protein